MIFQLGASDSARRLRAQSIDTWLGTPRGPLKMADRHFLLSANATIAWGDINGTHTPSVGAFSLAAPRAETFNPRHSKWKDDPFWSVSIFSFPLCCSVCSLFNSSLCLHSIYATPTDTARPRPLIYYSFNWPPKAPSLDVEFEPNSWFFPQQVFRPSASLAFAINMQILSLFKNN